jgi:hypothetical protein
MKSLRTLAACALACAALAAPAVADPGDDVLRQADDATYAAAVTAGNAVTAARAGGPIIDPPPPPTSRTLDYWSDAIFITDTGSGPVVTLGGVMGDPHLWSCVTTAAGNDPVNVTCTANPASGFSWQCGVMHVSAAVWSRPVDVYDWARDYVRTATAPIVSGSRRAPALPAAPDPRRVRWGQATGMVDCDGYERITGQADQNTPYASTVGPMGAVHTLICQARLSPASETRPVAPYEVGCIDPPNSVG